MRKMATHAKIEPLKIYHPVVNCQHMQYYLGAARGCT